MIVKMMKNDGICFSLRTITNVKETIHTRNENNEQLEIIFQDGSAEKIIVSEKTQDNSYQDLYTWIYLMNEKGQTIEKII